MKKLTLPILILIALLAISSCESKEETKTLMQVNISDVSPDKGIAGMRAEIAISGNGTETLFEDNEMQILFGGQTAKIIEKHNFRDKIIVEIPDNSEGEAEIEIISSGAELASRISFQYLPAPKIISVSDSIVTQGSTIEVHGENLNSPIEGLRLDLSVGFEVLAVTNDVIEISITEEGGIESDVLMIVEGNIGSSFVVDEVRNAFYVANTFEFSPKELKVGDQVIVIFENGYAEANHFYINGIKPQWKWSWPLSPGYHEVGYEITDDFTVGEYTVSAEEPSSGMPMLPKDSETIKIIE